jgi:hypothetical protein
MTRDDFYRPAHVEFQTASDGTNMPESFGTFETPEEMSKFIGGSLVAVNSALTCNRHMDAKEKKDMREEYSDLLENIVPVYEKRWSEADLAFTSAKKALKEAEENYNAEIAKTKELAQQVKRGLQEMDLDEKFTFRIAYMGRYYFYTWIDKELRLCLIRTILESEKQDLYNQMGANEEFIDREYAPKYTVTAEKKGKK